MPLALPIVAPPDENKHDASAAAQSASQSAAMPALEARHFTRWLAALDATVDAHHAGEDAESMKAPGHRVAYSMRLRLGITPESR